MIVGYARVSTTDQNPQLQFDALKGAKCERIFDEKKSGRSMDRKEWNRCLDSLRAGDVLVIWKLDRIGRSTRELLQIVDHLTKEGVQLQSLTESIDTRTAHGKLVLGIMALIAEHERNVNRERTLAGLESARARGRFGGAKPKTSRKQDQQMQTLWESKEHTAAEIAQQFSISEATFFRRMTRLTKPKALEGRA